MDKGRTKSPAKKPVRSLSPKKKPTSSPKKPIASEAAPVPAPANKQATPPFSREAGSASNEVAANRPPSSPSKAALSLPPIGVKPSSPSARAAPSASAAPASPQPNPNNQTALTPNASNGNGPTYQSALLAKKYQPEYDVYETVSKSSFVPADLADLTDARPKQFRPPSHTSIWDSETPVPDRFLSQNKSCFTNYFDSKQQQSPGKGSSATEDARSMIASTTAAVKKAKSAARGNAAAQSLQFDASRHLQTTSQVDFQWSSKKEPMVHKAPVHVQPYDIVSNIGLDQPRTGLASEWKSTIDANFVPHPTNGRNSSLERQREIKKKHTHGEFSLSWKPAANPPVAVSK